MLKLILKQLTNLLKKAIAKGNVIIENKTKGRKSKADLGVYNSNDEIIRLTGNVVIINQKSKLSGAKGITNLKTGISNIVGDRKNKKRVQGTFSPIKKQKKEIKLTSLEEELKRLKSSLNDQHNKNVTITNSLNKSENTVSKEELRINSISKTYNKRKVVNKVSLQLNKGEAVGLLGPNGAGKTTCFYMIAGLIDTDEGDIFLNKARINHLPMHMRSKRRYWLLTTRILYF